MGNNVRVAFVGHRQINFVYITPDIAKEAVEALHSAYESDEPSALELHEADSTDNLIKFLREYLPREKLEGASHDTLIRVSSAGLKCRSVDSRWKEIHVDNVMNQSLAFEPTELDSAELSNHAADLYRRFKLEPGQTWETTGRVYEHGFPSRLLGFDD